jgi:prepilin-type N-terminal cleavage/methylation domain-containing protein
VVLKREGFSLIELVLAIIVIAISLMSIPMLIGETSKSNQYSLIQESVMAARTKLGNILTFPWDQNSTIENNSSAITAVVVVETNGDVDLNRTAGTIYRRGHVQLVDRRHYDVDSNATFKILAQPIGHEPGEVNMTDIDDFDGSSVSVALTGGAGTEGDFDYLNSSDLNITTRVYFLNDTNTYQGAKNINFSFNVTNQVANTTNIKMIEISVDSAYSDDPFILRAFSSNIGANSQLHKESK